MQKRRADVAHRTRSIPTGQPAASAESWSERVLGIEPEDPAYEHIVRALAYLNLRFGFDVNDPAVRERAIETGRRDWQRTEHADAEWRTGRPDPVHVVYYVRIGQLVKIGTTGQLATRLKAFPPDAVVLATEPGTRELEHERHRQFRDTAATEQGEYFYPSAALVEHINSLREQPLTAADLAA